MHLVKVLQEILQIDSYTKYLDYCFNVHDCDDMWYEFLGDQECRELALGSG
jgi:hypothetical protein